MSGEAGGAAGVALLVVDDSPFNRLMLQRRLQALGYLNVTMAEDGTQGLAAIAAQRFDVVLLDLEMPNLDGIGVLERLHAGRGTAPPVIVISALTEMDKIVRCIELGAEDFLPKSFDPPLLRARLGAVLEKKRLRGLAEQRLPCWRRSWRAPAPPSSPWCRATSPPSRPRPRPLGGDGAGAAGGRRPVRRLPPALRRPAGDGGRRGRQGRAGRPDHGAQPRADPRHRAAALGRRRAARPRRHRRLRQ
ncbi:response regulator [Teichococcus aestuarii]|uniref:response regulator n=1 Tax=Teichococcus aestuarii TaxID=568898 RepID=UPI0036162C30